MKKINSRFKSGHENPSFAGDHTEALRKMDDIFADMKKVLPGARPLDQEDRDGRSRKRREATAREGHRHAGQVRPQLHAHDDYSFHKGVIGPGEEGVLENGIRLCREEDGRPAGGVSCIQRRTQTHLQKEGLKNIVGGREKRNLSCGTQSNSELRRLDAQLRSVSALAETSPSAKLPLSSSTFRRWCAAISSPFRAKKNH